MQLIPNRFLLRVSHPCLYVAGVPDDDEDLFRLPESCRLENFADIDGKANFADVRAAWNENGLAFEAGVRPGADPAPGRLLRRPRRRAGRAVAGRGGRPALRRSPDAVGRAGTGQPGVSVPRPGDAPRSPPATRPTPPRRRGVRSRP